MISHDDVVIVVPIYREHFSECEQVSLKQVRRILGGYTLVFMAPERMREFLMNNGMQAILFSDSQMKSIKAYNELLLSPAFYQKFIHWKYMLIYQLDAFVFKDQLLDFCNLNYDYIGAPWPCWYDNGMVKSHVGNGGLSLRNIESCKSVLSDRKVINNWRNVSQKNKQEEDLFFAYVAGRPDINFVSAPIEVAVRFSQEEEIRKCYQGGIERWLPFGCHGWSKRTFYAYWKPIIERIGYCLPDIWTEDTMLGLRQARIARMLTKRIIRGEKEIKATGVMRKMLDIEKRYSIHGGGLDGIRCLNLLRLMGFSIRRVYDQRATTLRIPNCTVEPLPVEEELKRREEIIIIATFNHECEISSYYASLGFLEGREYLIFSKIERDFTNAVYGFWC